ncbi:XRE family transcriptional regulator [Streptomyces sp. NPDC047880]|uniref:telomere-protecting terminal protein Tpg n=1 Tax=Streptomyces sp. NPDC047880 TaxID=3155626 RepID=UPI003453F945
MLGVSQRAVQRWVTKKPGARRSPGAAQVRVSEEAVSAKWQPRVRARRRARAEAEGFVLHTKARFGFAAAARSSDDPRVRRITQGLSGEVARELFAARDAGAGEQQQMVILVRALGHAYFRDGGRRAHGMQIAFTWTAVGGADASGALVVIEGQDLFLTRRHWHPPTPSPNRHIAPSASHGAIPPR